MSHPLGFEEIYESPLSVKSVLSACEVGQNEASMPKASLDAMTKT